MALSASVRSRSKITSSKFNSGNISKNTDKIIRYLLYLTCGFDEHGGLTRATASHIYNPVTFNEL
jgi:hypothetical protein